MRVLFIASSAYIPYDGRKTVTGYDYIVSEIAQKLCEKCDIDLYLLRPYPRSLKVGEVSFIGHSKKKLLKYLRIRDLFTYCKLAFRGKQGIKSRLRNISYYLTMRDIEHLIKKKNYDIVHIHGVTFMCVVSSLAPAHCNVPFLFTMHGLISYGIPNIDPIDQDSEQAILNMVKEHNFVTTTVSTGTKMIPCEDKGINLDKVVVINNAVKIDDSASIDWKEKYPQTDGKSIILSIGSISHNKNQIQLLRAFNQLPEEIKNNTMVFLAGQDLTDGVVTDYVKKNQLQDKVVICGFLTKKELAGLYKIANYNVLLSFSEGFGLSIIEAAKFGIPTLTYADLDAVKDLDPASMMLLNGRSDQDVVEGLKKMFSIDWNKESIIKSVDRFNDTIYFQYLDVYKHIIENKSNWVHPEVVLEAIGL